MHVIVATDGSQQSLSAARYARGVLDPGPVEDVSVVAVLRPLAAVSFADELSDLDREHVGAEAVSFRAAAEGAVRVVADVFDGWGPRVHRRIRSGSPATEIIRAARALDAGLVVVASGGRGLSDTVLLGSTAQRIQHSAPCPVLVVRPTPRTKRH